MAVEELIAFDGAHGHRLVAGADEAGRGALAGPIVCAAVLFDLRRFDGKAQELLAGLNDSKKLSAVRRAELFPTILQVAEAVTVISIPAAEIDRGGLQKCNLTGLARALSALPAGERLLVDWFNLDDHCSGVERVVGGDGKSAAIAAASIIAKVSRDRLMRAVDSHYPGYGFARHAGYMTNEHRQAVRRLGPCPLHRLSFNSAAFAD